MIRLCGAALGLLAFAVTLILGLLAGNPVEAVLLKGIWALFIFCGLGLSVGWVACRIIDEYAADLHRSMRPDEASGDERGESVPVEGDLQGETSPVAESQMT